MLTVNCMRNGVFARSFKLSGIGAKGAARFIASTALAFSLVSLDSKTSD